MFLLRAHRPERYGVAHRTAAAAEAQPAPEQPLPDALAALGPVPPADPHCLIPPAALAAAVDTARAVADVYDRYPVDEREPYAALRIPADHPVTHERRRNRRQRRAGGNGANDTFLA
ncbi:hypothetical protein [Sphingomonas sp. Leaf339]|uniref:hypothetical protein n=1 Tax=Sphingomonas sp. Leaf339 TaxID=1736343 RepID=UPI0009E786E5|nr:hypothetical protein [Sphingomonas sp. Leaf339]